MKCEIISYTPNEVKIMIEIQIALASNHDTVPSMFVLVDEIPEKIMRKYDANWSHDLKKFLAGWTIMVAHRPLLGDIEEIGHNVYGRHWVAIDPSNEVYDSILEHNRKLSGRIVLPITKEMLTQVALIGNKYKDRYMEMEVDERYSLLSPKVRKLEGLPHKELVNRLREVIR